MRPFDRATTSDAEAALLERLHAARDALAGRAAGPEQTRAFDALPPRFPTKVQIQTTTHCNAACAMCPYPLVTGADGFAHEQMSEARYRRILAQLQGRGVERLSLFLMNEPLLDVRMATWLGLARAALPDVRLGLFTNGAALSAERAAALAAGGLDELCISVHGFDRATYEAVMQKLSFDRLQHNLREVFTAHHAGELGDLRLKIVVGDIPEIRDTIERADPTYRDHVLLKAFSNEREATGVTRGLPSSAAAPRRREPLCQRPFVKLYVLANGDCVLCNVDWNRTVVLGRIGDDGGPSIEQVWNGDRYRDVRRRHLQQALAADHICARCDYAEVVDDE